MAATRRSAIITGGSAGIGLAIARMLAAEGWDLTLVARDPDKLTAAADGLAVPGASVQTHPANLADPTLGVAIVERHLQEHHGLDMLVSNAGLGLVGPIETKKLKHLDLELSVNFTSAYLLLQAAIPSLKTSAGQHGSSYVVNVSSLAAKQNPPNGASYAATKSALISLSNAAHAELSRFGIHVTALLPGFVETPGTRWVNASVREQMMPADDLAEAVRFLIRTSGRCYVPEIMMTTAGPGIWHSPIDWDTAAT